MRGLYLYRQAPEAAKHRAVILASGTAMLAALEAQEMLAADHDVAADVWSAPGWKQLREDAIACERWNRLHPQETARVPYVTKQLADVEGPMVAVTDWMRAVPDQITRFVPRAFTSLGTDGYGLSDTRAALRRYFEVDASHIVVAVLDGLAKTDDVKAETVGEAINRYGIDPEALSPLT